MWSPALLAGPADSPVRRYFLRLGEVSAPGEVDGDAEEQCARGQEVRCPVHPEAVAGVAGVDDEQDREHQCQDGDDHVPGEAGGVHLPVVHHAPLDLGEGGEAVGDGGGDAGHQHQGREDGGTVGAQVVDPHRDGGQHGGGDDAVGGHPVLGYVLEALGDRPSSAAASGISAQIMVQPFSAPRPEMMTAIAITLPAQVPPKIALAASENGAVALASLEVGRMPNTAISESMYTTAVAIVPRTVARGTLRSGSRTLAAATAAVSTPR